MDCWSNKEDGSRRLSRGIRYIYERRRSAEFRNRLLEQGETAIGAEFRNARVKSWGFTRRRFGRGKEVEGRVLDDVSEKEVEGRGLDAVSEKEDSEVDSLEYWALTSC